MFFWQELLKFYKEYFSSLTNPFCKNLKTLYFFLGKRYLMNSIFNRIRSVGSPSCGSQSLCWCNQLTSSYTQYFDCTRSSPSFTFLFWVWLPGGVNVGLLPLFLSWHKCAQKDGLYYFFGPWERLLLVHTIKWDTILCHQQKQGYAKLWSSY